MGHLQCCVCPNSQSGPTPLFHIGVGHFPSHAPPLSLGSLNRCHPAASLFLLSPEKGTLPPPRRHAEHRPSFPPIHPLATVPPSLALLPTPAPTTLSHPYLGRLRVSVVYYPHSLAGPYHPWFWLASPCHLTRHPGPSQRQPLSITEPVTCPSSLCVLPCGYEISHYPLPCDPVSPSRLLLTPMLCPGATEGNRQGPSFRSELMVAVNL